MKDEIKSFLIQIKGNDEWKEIYDYITNLQDKYKEADYDRHKLFEAKEKLQNDYQEAVDKITNLQEENKRLKEENKHIFANVNDDQLLRSNAMNYAELQDYKTRNEKAIEYINISLRDSFENDEYPLNGEDFEHLLNILQNGEQNE